MRKTRQKLVVRACEHPDVYPLVILLDIDRLDPVNRGKIKILMPMHESIKNRLRRSNEKERSLDRPLGAFSSKLWPWSESKLVLFIVISAILDYVSTYTAFKFGGNHVAEIGFIAKRALQTGGFLQLFFIDTSIVAILLILATVTRLLYSRLGLPGYGHAAFVFLLLPYAVIILAIVFNNILVAFLGIYVNTY